MEWGNGRNMMEGNTRQDHIGRCIVKQWGGHSVTYCKSPGCREGCLRKGVPTTSFLLKQQPGQMRWHLQEWRKYRAFMSCTARCSAKSQVAPWQAGEASQRLCFCGTQLQLTGGHRGSWDHWRSLDDKFGEDREADHLDLSGHGHGADTRVLQQQ